MFLTSGYHFMTTRRHAVLVLSVVLLVGIPAWSFGHQGPCPPELNSLARGDQVEASFSMKNPKFKGLESSLLEFATLLADHERLNPDDAVYVASQTEVLKKDQELREVLSNAGFSEAELQYIKDWVSLTTQNIRDRYNGIYHKANDEELVSRKVEADRWGSIDIELKKVIERSFKKGRDGFDLGTDSRVLEVSSDKQQLYFSDIEETASTPLKLPLFNNAKDDGIVAVKFIENRSKFVVARQGSDERNNFISINVLDAVTKNIVKEFRIELPNETPSSPNNLLITSDGYAILSDAAQDKTVFYDVATGKKVQSLKNFSTGKDSKSFSDGRYLVQFQRDPKNLKYSMLVWDLNVRGSSFFALKPIVTRSLPVRSGPTVINTQEKLIISMEDGFVEIRNLKSGEDIKQYRTQVDKYRYGAVSVSADGKILIYPGIHELTFYRPETTSDVTSVAPVIILNSDFTQAFTTKHEAVNDHGKKREDIPLLAEISPDGKWLAVVVSDWEQNAILQMWHVDSRKFKAEIPIGKLDLIDTALMWSGDSRQVLVKDAERLMSWKAVSAK